MFRSSCSERALIRLAIRERRRRGWGGEPPMMALEVTSAVLALPVGLILRLPVNRRAGVPEARVVRVDIIDVDHEPAVEMGERPRRRKILTHAVQPDPRVTEPDLTVDDRAIRGALDPVGYEAEHVHEVVMRSLDVFVDQNGNDRRTHAVHVSMRSRPRSRSRRAVRRTACSLRLVTGSDAGQSLSTRQR